MKTKIITAYTENFSEISDLSYSGIKQYGEKHSIPTERFLLSTTIDRPPSWYKIELVLQEFKKGYDCVMWVDADTMVVNFNHDFFSMLNDTHNIFLSEDTNGINMGVVVWKNTPEVVEILNKIWSMKEFINHTWWEQGAFRNLYDSNWKDIKNIVQFIPQNILNAYDYGSYGLPPHPEGEINPKSFIAHFPGWNKDSNHIRIRLMKKYINTDHCNQHIVETQFLKEISIPSDINEHMLTLQKYAKECDHITEMGVRWVVSTYAFSTSKPKTLISIDIIDPRKPHNEIGNQWSQGGKRLEDIIEYCKLSNIEFHFIEGDTTKISINETDLLFIDTDHTFNQLQMELKLHGNKAKKYIIFHDTNMEELWNAITEFLQINKHWSVDTKFDNNNGLTILKRII
jgi:hypothetical protein